MLGLPNSLNDLDGAQNVKLTEPFFTRQELAIWVKVKVTLKGQMFAAALCVHSISLKFFKGFL